MIEFNQRTLNGETIEYIDADDLGTRIVLLYHLLECGFTDFVLADESIVLSFSCRRDEFEKLNHIMKLGEVLAQNGLNIELLEGGQVVELVRKVTKKARKKKEKK